MKASSRLKQLEEENEDAMFVLLSDVFLDQIKVSDLDLHTLTLTFDLKLYVGFGRVLLLLFLMDEALGAYVLQVGL